MTNDTVVVASYRTRLEAELAGRFLEGAGVPYVLNSPEGMLHGPIGGDALILVRREDADLAREILLTGQGGPKPPGAERVAVLSADGAEPAAEKLRQEGIPTLTGPTEGGTALWVRRDDADRARRLLAPDQRRHA